jgi:acetylornithine deacetylase/succinyl-diaminopimelate desuccinylase-like protein
MGHTDTVGIQRETWPVDPFSALRKDGFIWGRGSSYDKPHVAAGLA